MRNLIFALFLIATFASPTFGQRDAPVWDSYLPRVVTYNQRTNLDFELTWHKGGGPSKQLSHAQMYVLLYLEKDEPQILELAKEEKHTNKKNKEEDLILAVLEKKKLAIVLAVELADADKSDATSKLKKKLRGGSNFDFEFSFDYSEILTKHKELGNFNEANVDSSPSLGQTYNDKVKLMLFIPVNDCPLATLVPEELRKSHDFAHLMDLDTSIQYFKPLSQSFQLRQLKDGDVVAYID